MSQAISLQTIDNQFVISIDKTYIEQEFIFRLMNRVRIEYLAKKADLDESIEELGEEMKANWWEKNKDRFIKE